MIRQMTYTLQKMRDVIVVIVADTAYTFVIPRIQHAALRMESDSQEKLRSSDRGPSDRGQGATFNI